MKSSKMLQSLATTKRACIVDLHVQIVRNLQNAIHVIFNISVSTNL